jgi:hypothetical protein
MKRRGINYDVGIAFSEQLLSRPAFDPAVVHRELAIIKNDLHCNAVRISGTDIDRLMAAAEDALNQGLEVWLSPQLHDKTQQETLNYIIACAKAAETLRKQWPKLVFILGCELTWFMQGILKGDNVMERIGNIKWIDTHNNPLNAFLNEANTAVREVFRGQVTYASSAIERVDWSLFDFVGLDYYREVRNRKSYGEDLKRHFSFGKQVVVTEVGVCTFRGAEDQGGRGFMIIDTTEPQHPKLNGNYTRDEALQARELTDMLNVLDVSGVEGAFVFTFISPPLVHCEDQRFDLDMGSYSIVKSYQNKHGRTYPDMPWEPKESFKAVAAYFAKR